MIPSKKKGLPMPAFVILLILGIIALLAALSNGSVPGAIIGIIIIVLSILKKRK